jgi:hypothetical protein
MRLVWYTSSQLKFVNKELGDGNDIIIEYNNILFDFGNTHSIKVLVRSSMQYLVEK